MPPLDLEKKLRDSIEGLVPGFSQSGDILGIAISGGPDSLSLLLASHAVFPGRIKAATVDHGLRIEAKDEALFVQKICQKRNIPHQILRPESPIRGNVQSAARAARYALLNQWMDDQNIQWLATAHHADDQLETLLMRLLRGSGLDGLSGIRRKRGSLLRPFLQCRKSDLIGYVANEGLTAVDDPSNADDDFDRVRVRRALHHLDGFDGGGATRSAAALDDAREALAWMVDGLAPQRISSQDDRILLDPQGLPAELQRRLLLRSLKLVEADITPRGPQIQRTMDSLSSGQSCTLGNIMCRGGDVWQFSPAPDRKAGKS